MNLVGRQADWGESNDAARRHLLALDDIQQRRTTAEWNKDACQALNDAVRLCFPDGTPAEEMPAENLIEQHDSYQQAQINTQRAERHADLTTARLELAEAEQTSHAHRASLALGIKSTLRQVALAFDELEGSPPCSCGQETIIDVLDPVPRGGSGKTGGLLPLTGLFTVTSPIRAGSPRRPARD